METFHHSIGSRSNFRIVSLTFFKLSFVSSLNRRTKKLILQFYVFLWNKLHRFVNSRSSFRLQ
jgi:hypothetical protein